MRPTARTVRGSGASLLSERCVRVGFQDRRKCISPKTMMWSTHSRRIDPISRSATPFCQGEARAVGFFPDAHGAQSARDDAAIDPVAIADEVVWSLIPGKCL